MSSDLQKLLLTAAIAGLTAGSVGCGSSTSESPKTEDLMNTEIELGAKDYAEVLNDTDLAGIKGRFLKLKVRLTSATLDKTPEISEISLK